MTLVPDSDTTVAAVEDLLPGQLDLLEKQLERQEDSMTVRQTSAGTRANILIGSSAVLGGAEIVTGSGSPVWTSVNLVLYLGAVLIGLWSFRSRMGIEPDLPVIIQEFASFKTISLRRELLCARLRTHEKAVAQLNSRHTLLVSGFIVLGLAFASSAIGTVVGLADNSPATPTEIRIVH